MRAADIDLDLAKQLWAEGKTDAQVAHAVGAPLGTLRTYKRRLGLTTPRMTKEPKTDVATKILETTTSSNQIEPIDLHFVLNDEEIYLCAGFANRALELLAYLSTIIQQEGAADHAAT